MTANRYILGPDDVRRTPADHAAAFPPASKRQAAKPLQSDPAPAPQPDPAPVAASDSPLRVGPHEKPTKGAKAK